MGKADIYARIERWMPRSEGVLRSLHEGFWLGLMTSSDLLHATAIRFRPPSSFYDTGHNLSGLFDWEQAAFDRFFTGCRSLLIGAAGAGREAIALVRRGIEVTAFECHPDLLARARELMQSLQLDISFLPAPPSSLPPGLGIFDAMILGWDALSHIPGAPARIAFLRSCRGHLRPGGPLLLSFQVRVPSRRHAQVSRFANFLRRLRRDPVRVEEGDVLAEDFRHTFTRDEIHHELQAADLNPIFYQEDPTGHAVALRPAE